MRLWYDDTLTSPFVNKEKCCAFKGPSYTGIPVLVSCIVLKGPLNCCLWAVSQLGNISSHFGTEFGFLGGLSLHLNHLIASRTANYDWPFGTLPFGLFGSIWTQGTLRHILGPILVIFEICQFLTISGPFEYFSGNRWSQKIKVFLMKERSLPPYRFSFRRRGP